MTPWLYGLAALYVAAAVTGVLLWDEIVSAVRAARRAVRTVRRWLDGGPKHRR